MILSSSGSEISYVNEFNLLLIKNTDIICFYLFSHLHRYGIVVALSIVADVRTRADKVSVAEGRVNARNCREDLAAEMDPVCRVSSLLTSVGVVPLIRHQSAQGVRCVL